MHDELLLDGNSRQNLATFCTTWAEPEAHRLMDESIDKNMIDKDEYPQTAEIENRCVHMIADLWHAPGAWKTVGMLDHRIERGVHAGRPGAEVAMAQAADRRRQADAKPNSSAGRCRCAGRSLPAISTWRSARSRCEGDALGLRPEDLRKYCDENTIGVIPTLGVTFTGVYEPVAALARALDELQRDYGLDIPIHVDAASGGFIAPFIQRSWNGISASSA